MKLPRIARSLGIVIAAYTSGLLLAGCASPIKSVPYVAGKPVEGIRYNLSKTTVKVNDLPPPLKLGLRADLLRRQRPVVPTVVMD